MFLLFSASMVPRLKQEFSKKLAGTQYGMRPLLFRVNK
jgi:hypothetical protein